MSKMIFADTFKFVPSERMYTDEGYLIAPARIARPGIQLYRGSDLINHPSFPSDKFNKDSVIKVMRPKQEVFDSSSINSFKNVPITDEHPPQLLTAKTVRQYQRGTVLSDVEVDEENECLKATIKVTDEEAVTAVKMGKVEMSAGYRADIIFEEGECEYGSYDAMQVGIEGNHVAIVPRARAGSQMRIADGYTSPVVDEDKWPEISVNMDGCSYKVKKDSKAYYRIGQMLTDSEAEFIREAKVEKDETRKEMEDEDYNEVNAGKPNKSEPKPKTDGGGASKEVNKYKEGLMDAEKELAELKLKYEGLEKENETLKAEVDVAKTALNDAESKVPTMDEIDALVADREVVVGKCKAIIEDIEVEGKSNITLKKEVVVAKMSHVDADNVSEAYIEAAFDLLEVPAEEEEKTPAKRAVGSTLMDKAMAGEITGKGETKEKSARDKFLERSREAWKN